jgi:FKBP-type peptidyl-prolyl cis-trans isomerase
VDGTSFYSSRAGGQPFETFVPSDAIEGFNQGILGMQAGGIRKISVPPHLGFGDRPPRSVPVKPGEPIIYEIECLDVQQGPNIQLPSGLRIESTLPGEGPRAGFGSWLSCQLMILAGENLRVAYATRDEGGPIDIALPAPPGILRRTWADPELPKLSEVIHGMRAGEYRIVTVPAAHAFRSKGNDRLGVRPHEDLTYEIQCLKLYEGPAFELANGLQIEDVKIGDGAYAAIPRRVTIRYTAPRMDGTIAESNTDPTASPLTFRMPTRRVIHGLTLGMQGMRVGGVRRLTIPAALAYGDTPPAGSPIQPGDTLIYEIQLLDVARR